MARFNSPTLKKSRSRNAARIWRWATCTADSALALSRGFLTRVGRMTVP